MFFNVQSDAVRLCGRWHIGENSAIATAVGCFAEFAFEGREVLLRFCMQDNVLPIPHVWISVDDGLMFEAALDSSLRVSGFSDGAHVVTVIVKSFEESQSRWTSPLVAKVELMGFSAERAGVLPRDDRKVIEFVGDSITEGIAIAPYFDSGSNNNDVVGTYGWLTAQALGMKPTFSAYGGVGVTAWGCGGVPPAADIYGYNFADSPTTARADVVVVNHGANDRNWKRTAAEYLDGYVALLREIRRINPKAKIVVLSAFCGYLPDALREGVEAFNRENNDAVAFVDSKDWIPPEPLHPLYDGHAIVAEHLTAELKKIL